METLIPPRLPGLLVRRPLGQGTSPPWLARADDGSWLVARRSPRPPELPEHPGLLAVFGSVTDDRRETWVVTAYTSGHGLDRRLARVGQVGRSLATSWAAALAEALAALHATGLVHGALDASRVLLGPRDTILLDASCARPGDDGARAADLRGLVALVEQASGERLAHADSADLEAALTGRLDAAGLARRLRARGPGRNRHRGTHARGASRGLLVVTAVVGLLAGAALLGVRLAKAPAQPAVLVVSGGLSTPVEGSPGAVEELTAAPTPAAPVAESVEGDDPDWGDVLADLDLARGLAFGAADPSVLSDVDAPGSEAERRDRALVRVLRTSGVVADGWSTRIQGVLPRAVRGDRVVLEVTDTRTSYVLRDASGAVVSRQPARGPTTWVVRLVATDAGWRISSVDEAAPSVSRGDRPSTAPRPAEHPHVAPT